MKYCIEYNKELLASPLFEEIDEVFIKLDTSPNFFSFLSNTFKDKRIILDVEDFSRDFMLALEKIKELSDLDLTFYIPPTFKYLDEVKDAAAAFNHISYFYDLPVGSWDQFHGIVREGVSDIIISNELGFELDKVYPIAHQYGVNVIVCPFVCQSSWSNVDKLKSFFIRPEDVKIYESYIDTFIFYGDKSLTYCQIYQEQKWFGNLKEIIVGLDRDLDSRFILPNFGEARVKCRKRCFKGGSCKICERIYQLSETLKDKRIMVKGGEDNG